MKEKFFFLTLIVFLSFGWIILRLVKLQVFEGDRYRILAQSNRLRQRTLFAGRGIIYDRKKQPLVANQPLYFLQGEEGGIRILSREEALSLEAKAASESARIQIGVGRQYLYGQSLAHLVGYLGETNPNELKDQKTSILGKELQLGDFVGRGGVEGEYDVLLRGKNGKEIIEVDSLGNQLRSLGRQASVTGSDLTLSVDAEFCQKVYEFLEKKPGAIVVSESKTGQIICLTSSPSFDPNIFSSAIEFNQIQSLLNDNNRPLFNRAIGGVYPPGSTFKIVTAIAGLEEKKIDLQTKVYDQGFIKIGDYLYRNWYYIQYGKTEGEVSLIKAIKRSNDTYFYKVGEWLGADLLASWAQKFGFGQKTGLDLPAEATGLVPSPKWKEETFGERWFLGNTYHFAIGQENLLATPLQVNLMTAVIANGGSYCRPRILQEGERLHLKKEECKSLDLQSENLEAVRKGMKEVCSQGGTAFPFFDFQPQVACKTGTAQYTNSQDKTHAWFTAFAPIEDPEIVVTVLVEGGGEGSSVAGPIAKKTFEEWFKIDS